jgi:glycine C-acetyltransferase
MTVDNKSDHSTESNEGPAQHGFIDVCKKTVADIREAGTYKNERVITTAQGMKISVNGQEVLNFCANNYLGLANHPRVVQAAKDTLDSHGFGMSSVRFICGT